MNIPLPNCQWLVVGCLVILLGTTLRSDVVSTFSKGDEGWIVINHTDTFGSGPYRSEQRTLLTPPYPPRLISNDKWGDCLFFKDQNPKVTSEGFPGGFFFTAPRKYLGDIATTYGKSLSYALGTENIPGEWYSDADILMFGRNGKVLVKRFPQLIRSGRWVKYEVAMVEDQWHLDNVFGPIPTRQLFLETLTDVSALWIRGENFWGIDSTYFDDFRLESDYLTDSDSNGLRDDQEIAKRRATATPQVVNGFVVGITITDGGFGYTEPPVVLIQDSGGTGAKATATVVNGVITAINITNPGTGYTSAPRVSIASPPFSPGVAIVVSKVKVQLSVVLGRRYQLEASLDLKTWAATGVPFEAQEEELEQEFDVAVVGQYFRITQVP